MAFYLKYKVDNNDKTALITADSLITLLTNNTDISEDAAFDIDKIYKRSYSIYTIDDITDSLFTNFFDTDDAEMMISFTRPAILAIFLLKQSNTLSKESAKNLIRMADGSSRVERLVALLVAEKEYEKTLYKLYNAVEQIAAVQNYGPKVRGNNYLLRYLSNQTIEDTSTWDQTIFASVIRNDVEHNPYLIIKKMLDESKNKNVTLPGIAFYRTFQACKYPGQINGYVPGYDNSTTDYDLAVLKPYLQNNTVTAIDIVSDLPFRFEQAKNPGVMIGSDLDTIKSVCNSFATTLNYKGADYRSWGTNMFLDQVQTTDAVREVIFHALLAMNPNSNGNSNNNLKKYIASATTGFLQSVYVSNQANSFKDLEIYTAVTDHGYFLKNDIPLYEKFITLDREKITWSHRRPYSSIPYLPYIYPRTFPYWWNVGGGGKYVFVGAGNANIAKTVVAYAMDGLKVTALTLTLRFAQATKLAAKVTLIMTLIPLLGMATATGALGLVSDILNMFTNTPTNIDRPYQISNTFLNKGIQVSGKGSLNRYVLTEREMSFNKFNSLAEKKSTYLKTTYEEVLNKVQPYHEMFTERIFTSNGNDRSEYVDNIMRTQFINNDDRNSAEISGYSVLTESSIWHKVAQFQETLSQFQQVEFYDSSNYSNYANQKGAMWNQWMDKIGYREYFTRAIHKSAILPSESAYESKMLYTIFNQMLDGSFEAKHFLSAIKTADFYIRHADSDKDLLPTEVVTELARIFQFEGNPAILAYMAEAYENLNKQKVVRDGHVYYPVDTTTTSIKFALQDLNTLISGLSYPDLSPKNNNLYGSQKLAFLYARAFLRAYQKSISNLITDVKNITTFNNDDGTPESFYIENPMKLDGIAANMLSEMRPEWSTDSELLSQEMKDLKTYMNSLVKLKNYIDFYRNVTKDDILYEFMKSDAYRILKEGV